LRRALARVPTKVTLFGEHAVVYGYPAIAAAVPKRIDVEARFRSDGRSVIRFEGVEIRVPLTAVDIGSGSHEARRESIDRIASYVSKAIEVCSSIVGGIDSGIEVSIRSSLPPSIGLGTSAAVSAGVLATCLELNGVSIDARELAKLAWRVELEVQGAASPMDTATVCLGGVVLVDPVNHRHRVVRDSIDALVGYVPRLGSTATLVAYVKKLRGSAPRVVESIMRAIAAVVDEGLDAVEKLDYERLGMLANANHGLLHALGVVSESSDRVVHALRRAGAYGAKMSGAGGGGAFVAFAQPGMLHRLAHVARALGAEVVSLKAGCSGIEVEQL